MLTNYSTNLSELLPETFTWIFFFTNYVFSVEDLQNTAEGKPLQEVIADVLNGKWDHERTKFSLPPLMTLVSILTCLLYLATYRPRVCFS